MRDWIKKRKTEILIFFLALPPRLIFMLAAFWKLGDEGFVRNQDGYLNVGLNLFKYGVFTGSRIFPLVPNSFPSPGYPIILAISWLIIPRFLFVVFWQNILYSLFIVFVYKFAKLFFNDFISIGAALLMAFEPFSFYWSNVAMSETPFLFFFILCLYYLALFWQRRAAKYFVFSAFFLGIAALIRPVVFYFYPVVAVVSLIMLWRKIAWQNFFKFAVVYLIIFLLVISPWCLRNKIRFDAFTLSNLPHFTYFLTASRDFLILERGMSQAEADAEIQKMAVQKTGVKSFEEILYKDKYIPALKEISFSLIKQNPFSYLKWHIIKALPVLTDSGWPNMLFFWGADVRKVQSISLSNLFGQRDIKVAISALMNNYVFLARILGIGFWLLIDLFAFAGAILMAKKKEHFQVALAMLGIIGYFIFVSSWTAMARLRLPFQPLLFVFLIYFVYFVFYGRKANKQER